MSTFRQQMADFARGEQIRRLRDGRHLSQEDAAHEIGVSTKTLRNWEQGGKIKWDNAKKLAAFYGVEPDSLVSREVGDPSGTVLSAEDVERLKRIEEKMDEILRRLEPAEPDDVPDALPPAEDPPPDETGEGEAETG